MGKSCIVQFRGDECLGSPAGFDCLAHNDQGMTENFVLLAGFEFLHLGKPEHPRKVPVFDQRNTIGFEHNSHLYLDGSFRFLMSSILSWACDKLLANGE